MRVLFLVLLLANLLFLAWTRWVVMPEARQADRAAAGAPDLRPIRLQQEQGAAEEEALDGESAAVAAASCVSVGPYLQQAQADAASASLQRLGFGARLRAANDEVRIGHWVRVTGFATPEDAMQTLGTLRSAGFADADVVDEEGVGPVISIGVYTDEARATEVAATVSRAGLTPETRDRLRTLDVFWLDVDRQANGGIPELEDAGPAPDGGLPLELRVCPSATVDEGPAAAQPAADRQFGGLGYDRKPTAPSVPA